MYTLDAALFAAVLWLAQRWTHTNRPIDFYATVLLLAIAAGNRTTILALAPGLAVCALAHDRRFALKPTTIGVSAVLFVLGLLQYGFIVLRSSTPGAYVESSATTFGQLVSVMRGSQFAHALFVFSWNDVVLGRLPWLTGSILARELTAPGLVLAGIGAYVLMRHHRQKAFGAMLLTGAGIIFAFALNYDIKDIEVVVIPTMLALWVMVGVAVHEIGTALARRDRIAATALFCAAAAIPVVNFSRNFDANDLSREYAHQAFFDGLIAAVPDRTVIVREDFTVDRMVNYELIGERAGGSKDIRIMPPDPDRVRQMQADGFTVLAFGGSASRLRVRGFDFDWSPWPLAGESLSDFVEHLPDGSGVAVALPAYFAGEVSREVARVLDQLGASATPVGDGSHANVVLYGVRGGRDVLQLTGHDHQQLDVPIGTTSGPSLKAGPAVSLEADVFEASIRRDSRSLIRTSDGVAVAVWSPDGTLRNTFVLSAASRFRVPLTQSGFAVFQLRPPTPQRALSVADQDVTPFTRAGLFLLDVAPGAELTAVVETSVEPAIRVLNRTSPSLVIDIDACDTSDCIPASAARVATRIRARLPADAEFREIATIAIGSVPLSARARSSPAGSVIQAMNIDGLLSAQDPSTGRMFMANNEQAWLLGGGWSPISFDDVGPFRGLDRDEATLVVPSLPSSGGQLVVEALGKGCAGGRIALRVGQEPAGEVEVVQGWHAYTWDVAGPSERRPVEVRLSFLPSACRTAPSSLAISTIDVRRLASR